VKSADNIDRNEEQLGNIFLSTTKDIGIHFGKAHPTDMPGQSFRARDPLFFLFIISFYGIKIISFNSMEDATTVSQCKFIGTVFNK